MSQVRTTGTNPEFRLRSLLHGRGLRYRVNHRPTQAARCRADLVFGPARVAVFVDGCFWHGCSLHPSWPKSNAEWWRAKIEKNRSRDAETERLLSADGWAVVRVWEHDDPSKAADAIEALVLARRPGPSRTRRQS